MTATYRLTEADRARLAAAFHEAGHAVAAVALGGRIEFASIDDEPRTEFDTLPAGTDAAVTYPGPWTEARWLARRNPLPPRSTACWPPTRPMTERFAPLGISRWRARGAAFRAVLVRR